jgi:N-methylhydantoinase A
VSTDLRVGIDIGGTFTDLSILDAEGIVAVGKTLTTHGAPAEAVVDALTEHLRLNGLNGAQVRTVVHGTTLVTNALIERRGSRTALLTTEGFRDVLEMGREHRYELYDLELELPKPLVPRHLRVTVKERILADGTIDCPLDEDQVREVAREMGRAGIEAVAICFLHSHANSEHELRAAEIFAEVAPNIRVACSSRINPEIREYERFSTTAANVYVQSVVEDYLADLRQRLRAAGIAQDPLIMLSNGGVTGVDVAMKTPIKMLESGPAGGALGAVAFARSSECPDVLAFDMGGTTAKLCLIDDFSPLITHVFEVNRVYRLRPGSGLPVRAPVIDMIEIGAGGGSIARVNSLGLLTIGPDSAGSDPGPVCYGGGGGDCTVTDADVVLGYLDPDNFLGGKMSLDAEASARAIEEQLARPMGVTTVEAAWGVHATVNETMANAARVHAIERGIDVENVPLFASGGNGPLHGPGLAVALGSSSVIVPPAAGVLSTLGFLSAPTAIDVARSVHVNLADLQPRRAEEIFRNLESEGAQLLRKAGSLQSEIEHQYSLDMRFSGQGNEIEIPIDFAARRNDSDQWKKGVRQAFVREYTRKFGTVVPDSVDLEILTWRVRSQGPEPHTNLRFRDESNIGSGPKRTRKAYFPGCGFVDTSVFDRSALPRGVVHEGPALVEEPESTLVVPPNSTFHVTDDFSIVVRFYLEETREV